MKKRRKFLFVILFFGLLLPIFTENAAAEDYTFRFEKAPDEVADDAYEEYLNRLPEDIREKIGDTEDAQDAQDAIRQYDVSYFAEQIRETLLAALLPGCKTLSGLLGMVILASAFRMLSGTLKTPGLETAFSLCCTLCMALTLYQVETSLFQTARAVLDLLGQTMLLILPVMESVYISGGNITAAAVSGTGISLMITFLESFSAQVLAPCVSICFLLSITAAVTGNRAIAFMTGTLRGIVTGILVLSMALMNFVLSMQTGIATAADTFAAKTIKFALGSYLPIVGGSVAESFSMLSASAGVIKQLSGTTGIVVIVLILLAPIATLIVNRIALGISGSVAGALSCDREQALIREVGSLCTLMIAIVAAAGAMYILALSLFCKASLAYH